MVGTATDNRYGKLHLVRFDGGGTPSEPLRNGRMHPQMRRKGGAMARPAPTPLASPADPISSTSLTGNIDVTGTLTFNQANAVTLSNVITSSGAIIQQGAGLRADHRFRRDEMDQRLVRRGDLRGRVLQCDALLRRQRCGALCVVGARPQYRLCTNLVKRRALRDPACSRANRTGASR